VIPAVSGFVRFVFLATLVILQTLKEAMCTALGVAGPASMIVNMKGQKHVQTVIAVLPYLSLEIIQKLG
jgi:hypothetical protein